MPPSETPSPTNTLPPDGDHRWDEHIGADGFSAPVRSVAADGRGNVYAGGQFDAAGGDSASNVASWNGHSWNDMSGGTNAPVLALTCDPLGYLYAGGEFTLAGGLPIRNLARWDGVAWAPVGGGVGGAVVALTVDVDGNLYAGGLFENAGGVAANHVAMYDGRNWSALGDGLEGDVVSLSAARDGNVHAVARVTNDQGAVMYSVWRWTGEIWQFTWSTDRLVTSVAAGHDGTVFIGGDFSGGIRASTASSLETPGGGLNGSVHALTVDDDGYLYAAGRFAWAGSTSVSRVARWDGAAWHALGSGLSGSGYALDADPLGLYAGGDFSRAGGKRSVRIGWYHFAGVPSGSATSSATLPADVTPTATSDGSCYTLQLGVPDGGSIHLIDGPDCGTQYTFGTVVRLRAEADPGFRWTAWRGDAGGTSIIANVRMTENRQVDAEFSSESDPRHAVLLLHDAETHPFAEDRACPVDGTPVRVTQALVDGGGLPVDDIEVFARHLLAEGMEVWIGSYDAGVEPPPPLTDRSGCVRDQLRRMHELGVEDVSVVAHGFGGWVARAYLESSGYTWDALSGRTTKAVRLVTLGTAHDSPATGHLGCRLASPGATDHVGLCGSPGEATTYNGRVFSMRPRDAAYHLLGGVLTPPQLWSLPYASTDSDHDGLVGVHSSLGRAVLRAWPDFWQTEAHDLIEANGGADVSRYTSDASHFSPAPWRDPYSRWYASFFNNTDSSDISATETYRCLREVLGIASSGCSQVSTDAIPSAQSGTSSGTSYALGHLGPAGREEHEIVLDSAGPAYVGLAWVTGTLGVTLIDPVGTTIDAAYAVLNPDDITYVGPGTSVGAGFFAGYYFESLLPGTYRALLRTIDVPEGGSDYVLASVVETDPTLVLGLGRAVYDVGSTAVISAGLRSGPDGVSGAQVTAYIAVPGSGEDTLTLADQGDGVYASTWAVPLAGGPFPVRVVAEGADDRAFERVAFTTLYAESVSYELAGEYSGVVRDGDGDGLYDSVAFTVGISTTVHGPHLVSADLVDASGQHVAHATVEYGASGTSASVVLEFDGDSIRRSALNGPYRLKNLTIVDLRPGFSPVLLADSMAGSTGSLDATEFAASCYAMIVTVEPIGGGEVVPVQEPDCNRGVQYAGGGEVSLDAYASPGYEFVGWTGAYTGTGRAHIEMFADRWLHATFRLVATPTPTPTSVRPTATFTPTPTVTPSAGSPTPTDGPPPSATPTPTASVTRVPGPRAVYLPWVSMHD